MNVQLGRLPLIPDKRRLLIGPPAAVPAPLPVVDHLSPIYPIDMGGNDKKGDCVVVATRTSLQVSWHYLCPNEPLPVVTAQDCVNAYEALVGPLADDDPGPGLVTEKFLDWLTKNPLHPGDPRTQALAWGRIRDDWTSLEEVNSEFGCGIYGVVIHAAQEYPSRLFDNVGGAVKGGHEICGGRHDASYVYANTWAYETRLTRSYVANDMDEHHVIIWPHVWDALSPDRRASIAADYQALTGRPFPAPPVTEVTVPSTVELFVSMPPRIADSRHGQGTAKAALKAGESRFVQVAGVAGVPANATGVFLNLTATAEAAKGWLSVTPITPTAPYSTVNFPANDNRANGAACALVNGGVVVHNGTTSTCHFVLDVSGYLIPA